MKKWIVLSLMLIASKSYAMSNKDAFQNWRATETNSADSYVFLASGCPCVVFDLTVTTGSAPTNAGFQYFGSTVTERVNFNKSVTTSTLYDIKTTASIFPIAEVIVSSSIYYTKTGGSTIRLRWDYYMVPPKGRERIGYKP